jgi:hypothetical protein
MLVSDQNQLPIKCTGSPQLMAPKGWSMAPKGHAQEHVQFSPRLSNVTLVVDELKDSDAAGEKLERIQQFKHQNTEKLRGS